LVSFGNIQYVVPVVHELPATVLSLNVGGAIVPLIL
jgi:uncharacterized membrane protein